MGFGLSIALPIRSLDLFAQLIANRSLEPSGAFKGWCAVHTLQETVFRGQQVCETGRIFRMTPNES